jgi:glycine hydroxymethyltransferase
MIMVTTKGLEKDPDLAEKVDKAVFPGLQGGPHDHQTAAIAVALDEAAAPGFKKYAGRIVTNAGVLAETLKRSGIKLVGGGTENHLVLVDLVPVFGPGGGVIAQEALAAAGITVNKNTIPGDPSSPFYPSGIRLGTPALTTRGMCGKEMVQIGHWISRVIESVSKYRLPDDKTARQKYVTGIRDQFDANTALLAIRNEIRSFCRRFPLP